MGFIKYHGTGESHYDDVVEYADIQYELERQKQDEKKKSEWFAAISGDPRYASVDANTLVKLAVKAYRDAADQYRSLRITSSSEMDPLQLWQDLWLYGTERCFDDMEIPEEKQEQLLSAITGKMLRLEGKTSPETQISQKMDRRYQRYLCSCFAAQDSKQPAYWPWLTDHTANGKTVVPEIISQYEKYSLFLSYYFYQSVHPSNDNWMRRVEREREALDRLKILIRRGQSDKPPDRKLKNPLYAVSTYRQMLIFTQALLFRSEKASLQEDPEMIEELYDYLHDDGSEIEKITSILPVDAAQQIREGKLPAFADTSITGLQPDETIHYVNHAIVFRPAAEQSDEPFRPVRATVAITDRRIAFRSAGINDILISDLCQITKYDISPSVLAFLGTNQVCYVNLPDIDEAYRVLQMLANAESREQSQGAQIPFSYQELVEKADLGACIFAFECLESYPFPEELRSKVRLLIRKLHGLKTAVENHPERSDEVVRFLSYYLPEAVRLMLSYHEYQSAALDEKTLQKTYAMIADSIDTLDAAVEQKILSIYNMEAMETRAKADALKQILEQDGYSKGSQLLKH